MKVKKNLSLEDDILEKGKKRAKDLCMNFSSYITYLINKDVGEIAVTVEPKKIKNDKVKNAIDSILGD